MAAKPMVKDKGGAKKTKGNKDDGDSPGKVPAGLLSAYVKTCQSMGLTLLPNDCIVASLKNTERDNYGKQIILQPAHSNKSDEDDDLTLFDAGRCRALALAISGRGHGSQLSEDNGSPIVYSLLTDLRVWQTKIGDDGASALADMLRLGGKSLNISYLELLDTKIEVRGALALGKSLSCAMNTTLTTLNLDFNQNLKSDGIAALCRGLRTNSTLKHLSAQYCSIDTQGTEMIAEMLAFKRSALVSVHLAGNRIGGKGLVKLSQGLSQNGTLAELNIADNEIRFSADDMAGLEAFGSAIATHPSLVDINLVQNCIGNNGGRVLVPHVSTNKKIESFKVDPASVLDEEVYNALNRCPSKAKTKGKKKKK